MYQLRIKDTPAMEALGQKLASASPPGSKLFLQGELGTGKTTLSRGFLNELGYEGIVKSPTYTLIEPYQFGDLAVFHFDLYRLSNAEELETIGIRDYFAGTAICLVEWPEKGMPYIGEADVHIYIRYEDEERHVLFETKTRRGNEIISFLS